MTTDRHEQAGAEAERRVATKRERLWDTEGEHLSHTWGEGFQAGFREAAEWVNAQPRTITREELAEAVGILEGEQEEGALGTDALYQALTHLRIEQEDDDE